LLPSTDGIARVQSRFLFRSRVGHDAGHYRSHNNNRNLCSDHRMATAACSWPRFRLNDRLDLAHALYSGARRVSAVHGVPAPFIRLASPSLYTALAVSSSIFLFAFYNITSGGLPWSVALAMDESSQHWIVWSLLPWSVLIAGAVALWLKRS